LHGKISQRSGQNGNVNGRQEKLARVFNLASACAGMHGKLSPENYLIGK